MDDQLSRYPPPMLEFLRAEIVQIGMATDAIVKDLDIVKDPMPGFGSGRIQTGIDLLHFEGMEKRLGTGIVVTVSFATHALAKPSVRQGPSEGPTGRLAAPVGVEDHAFAR